MFTPYKINLALTMNFTDSLSEFPSVIKDLEFLSSQGWKFYVVDQSCGKCYYQHKTITIPAWIYSSRCKTQYGINYWIYYICHEMAHTYAMGDMHGPKFMQAFMRICPESLQHHELGYKSRNAKAAGISMANLL